MSWIFVLLLNGQAIDVETFSSRAACQDKVRMYNAAFKQSGTNGQVWCEHRKAS